MADDIKEGTYTFKAEISQLLDILIHSLYKERDIFLRELISNASDALTRIKFEMLTNQDVLDPESELGIWISVVNGDDEGEKEIIIKDHGIGMDREELIYNLGTIAQSGAREFLSKIAQNDSDVSDVIGQFGVGFYSVFMVAKEVKVISHSYMPDSEAVAWISSGGQEFTIEPATLPERGTEIHIKLRDDAQEFADDWALKRIVKKYSDYVNYPIYVGDELANQQLPLWRKAPSDVTEEEYNQFYQQMTMDFDEPLEVIHFMSDAPLNIRALLFIPAKREKSMLNLRNDPGLMLYSHSVMIQEYSQDLLPQWLNFVDGVVDSEDLPLNVSRESIQNTRIIRQLAKTIYSRLLKALRKKGETDSETYAEFWHQYGRVLKEGLIADPSAKDDLLPLFRFHTSRSGDDLRSLQEYTDKMAENQEQIYYVLGDSLESIAYSPHLDPFKDRGLEVLYLADPLDSFLTPVLTEFDDHKLINIDDPELALPEIEKPEVEPDEKVTVDDASFNRFVGRCVTTLGDRVTEVRQSKILRNSPVRLVSPDSDPNRDMQRIRRFMDEEYETPPRILELNRSHALISRLSHLVTQNPSDPVIDPSIEQLYESALILEGLHPNPITMLPRIQSLIELAVDRSLDIGDEEE